MARSVLKAPPLFSAFRRIGQSPPYAKALRRWVSPTYEFDDPPFLKRLCVASSTAAIRPDVILLDPRVSDGSEDRVPPPSPHGVLALRPGMDWKTMSGLSPGRRDLHRPVGALEDRCRQNPKAAAPRFVLAYHYLVTGHTDAAVAELKALITAAAEQSGGFAASSRC